jgi:hypothetical protein
MSPLEETAKVATGFIDTMKTQPLALALCVMNFALIGFIYYQSNQFNTQRQDNVKLFLDVQKEVQKLLSQCIVPPPVNQRGDLRLQDDDPPLPRPRPRTE